MQVTDEYCTDNSKHRQHYYQGKRSGVRFATPQNISNAASAEGTVDTAISTTIPNSLARVQSKRWLMFGEVLHIARPALYAQLMSKQGWVPILVSLLLDLCSRACTCQAMKSQYQEAGWVPSPHEVVHHPHHIVMALPTLIDVNRWGLSFFLIFFIFHRLKSFVFGRCSGCSMCYETQFFHLRLIQLQSALWTK